MNLRPFLIFASLLLLWLSACSGGSAQQQLAEESLATMQEFGATLTKVTDKASADAHKDELEALAKQIADYGKRSKELGAPSEAEQKSIMEGMEEELSSAQEIMKTEVMRIMTDPEVGPLLLPILGQMTQ